MESPIPDAGDGVRNGDRCETCAIFENFNLDFGEGVREGDRGQSTAVLEGRLVDDSDGVRDGDGGQPAATLKGITGNSCHIIANIQCGQVSTIKKW